jgi:hypothetical protein
MQSILSLYGILTFLIILYRPVLAWSDEGHQAVSMIAVSGLSPHVQAVVKRLLAPEDMVDIGSWGHHLEKDYPLSSKLYYIYTSEAKQSCGKTLEINEENCQDSLCLVGGLEYLYKRLQGENVNNLKCFPKNELTEADALKLLVNLLADLHQPLRVAFEEDLGGKTILIRSKDSNWNNRTLSLFYFYDSFIIEKMKNDSMTYWDGGWTHVRSLASDVFANLKKEWEETSSDQRILLFRKWANEAFISSCNIGYKNLLTKQNITSGDIISLSEERLAYQIIHEKLLIAGARIAIVLNSIFKHRDLSKLRKTSSFLNKR